MLASESNLIRNFECISFRDDDLLSDRFHSIDSVTIEPAHAFMCRE